MQHPSRTERRYRTWSELGTEDAARGRAVLADALAGEDPQAWLSRLILTEAGIFHLAYEQPVISAEHLRRFEGLHLPSPKNMLATEVVIRPIPEALAVLRSPENPELEIERRRRAHNDELDRAAREDAARGEEHNRRLAEEREWEQRRAELHGDQWDELPGYAKTLFRLALIFERHRLPELAADIRLLAGEGVLVDPTGRTPGTAAQVKPRRWSFKNMDGLWKDGPALPTREGERWWP